MIHLILFSLKRRFVNKMSLFLVVVMSIIFLFIGFSDVVIDFIDPSFMSPMEVELNLKYNELFNDDSLVKSVENAPVKVFERVDGYEILSSDFLNTDQELLLKSKITEYHFLLSGTLFEEPAIEMNVPHETTNENHDILFVVITMIYFMIIGFAAMIAQEIVGEKTTNILELIGISISLRTHYYSKILIGWLSMFFQIVMGGLICFFTFIVRYLVDDGVGLIQFVNELGLFELEIERFSDLFGFLRQNQSMLKLFGVSLLFLLVGILFIQMFLVLLCTQVTSLEEASSIQSPFYIVLLVLYYVCMFLNNPDSMTKGIGYVLSFVPVASMIFMPSRILIYSPTIVEIVFSFVVSFISLVLLVRKGEKWYVETVLDSSKNSQSPLIKRL